MSKLERGYKKSEIGKESLLSNKRGRIGFRFDR